MAAAKHPGSRKALADFDQAARLMLEANSGDADVAAFLNHIDSDRDLIRPSDITITGSRDYLLGSTLDNAGIWVGEQGNAIKQGVGRFIQDHPGVGTALTLADGAFAVIAPTKYLAGMTLDYFKDEATDFIADKMTGPQMWSVDKGQAGGSGFVLAGGILIGGLGTIRNAHLAGGNHPKTNVPYDSDGFPDFSAYATHTVTIDQTGERGVDYRAANRAAGLKVTPKGYTWHHHQDGKTMQLIPTPLHQKSAHTGGVALRKKP